MGEGSRYVKCFVLLFFGCFFFFFFEGGGGGGWKICNVHVL